MLSKQLVGCVIAGGGGTAVYVDLTTRRVPNWLTGGLGVSGLLLAATHVSGLTVPSALAGGATGLGLLLPGYVLGATGAGDVKLLMALGTLLGAKRAVTAFLCTAIVGALIALMTAARRGRLRTSIARTTDLIVTGGGNVAEIEHPAADNRFAYAVAIALGALAAFTLP